MSRSALLDLNILIALAWPSHIHHRAAHQWFQQERHYGWATCPITQCGFVRISANPAIIPEAVSLSDAVKVLKQIIATRHHQFWPDSVSLAKAELFQSTWIIGHKQVTDAYLLSLAIERNGRLVTFDQKIPKLMDEKFSDYVVLLKDDI